MNQYEDDFGQIIGSFPEFDHAVDTPVADDGSFVAPLIPLRDIVVYPNMVTPLYVGRDKSLEALFSAQKQGVNIVCITQRNPDVEQPTREDLYDTGVEMVLGRTLRLPEGLTSALAQGRRRVKLLEIVDTAPYYTVRVQPIDETTDVTQEIEAQMRTAMTLFAECVSLNRNLPDESLAYAANIDRPDWLADFMVTTLSLTTDERQELLDNHEPSSRLMQIIHLLKKETQVLAIEDEIHSQLQQEVDKTQREMFLREQIRVIQNELGEQDIAQKEMSELTEKIINGALPAVIREKAVKELNRLTALPMMAPEVGIIRTYLDWLTDLPWDKVSEDNLDIIHAEKTLEEEHYGLSKAKERIVEHIAVRTLAESKMKTPILCFVGPPGTGKTSLGRSIANALGREFVRVSLGGVRDEAEIRGHRRTYIGAMPGRIIQTIKRAGTINPVFMLDEIDKLGLDYRGDPAAALLEVLDPEQNSAFSDHYLEVDYDLSKVMFVTTANYLDPIPPALLDRMEIIEFPGYIEEEKLEIARRFLIPKELEAHGISDKGITFELKALQTIIREYTYEAGVRNFEREIATICRKIARRVVEGRNFARRITAGSLPKYLGPPKVPSPLKVESDEVGIAQGLAWTAVGGDVLPVEVTLMPGKGNLTLTGQLGDVMQESAQAALSYTRSRADDFDIPVEAFEELDIHIHLPEGAIPKDGPSAGITLATALISAFTDRPVRHDVVMTGEITLRGRVLSVGGVREKVIAAHRAGIKTVIIPKENKVDLEEVTKKALREIRIVLADKMDTVLEAALLDPLPSPDQPQEEEAAGETGLPAEKPDDDKSTPEDNDNS